MKINAARLLKTIKAIGCIGEVKGQGITRLAYSDEYAKAARLLKGEMLDAGLAVREDGVGNIFGRRSGAEDSLPVILTGSHLDTVKRGGLYDGNLGICSALEVVRVLNENNVQTKHPLEIVAFTAEEGDLYGGTFGSRAMTGMQDADCDWLLERLQACGITRQDLLASRRELSEIFAFVELHIEQGGFLQLHKKQIGIVNGIAGISRFKITVKGEANHAGTTPMSLRRDALVAAAKLIAQIDKIARELGDPFVATVGVLSLQPGFANVIAGEVNLTLEMRDLEQTRIDEALEKIRAAAGQIEAVAIEIAVTMEKASVKTNAKLMQVLEALCRENDLSYQVMPSGAGHDAKALAQFVPTGMIFIPSLDGKSHCPEEYSSLEDIAAGAELLLQTILTLDAHTSF